MCLQTVLPHKFATAVMILPCICEIPVWIFCRTQTTFRPWGGDPPPTPEIIPKFWQSRAEFPVPWKIHPKNLIRIPFANWAEPLTRRLPPPDPCPLCPLSSTEFVETPPKKNSGYVTAYHGFPHPFKFITYYHPITWCYKVYLLTLSLNKLQLNKHL
jgi:hypothetical protein